MGSAGLLARLSEMPSNTSFNESANECAASASIAVDPDVRPAINFAIAITTFAMNAIMIVRALSPRASL